MKKVIPMSSIPRPIIFSDREQRIKRETDAIKQKQKDLYAAAKKSMKKED
ncbi:hypothetical protein SFC50_02305 [Bacillus infantis]